MKFTAAFLFLLFHFLAFSQTTPQLTEKILTKVPRSIVKYQVREKRNVYFLETGFNDAIFKDAALVRALAGKVILKAELIYTTYHKSETFDQHGLNRKRLRALFALAPNVAKQPGIEWVLMAQTGCTSPEAGKDFFHGMVITVREDSPDLTATETDYLEAVASGKIPATAYEAYLKNNLRERDSLPKVPVASTLPEFRGGERARIDYFTRNLKYPEMITSGPARNVAVQFTIDKNGDVKNVIMPAVANPTPYHNEVRKFVETMPKWKAGTVDGKPVDCIVQFNVDFMERGTVAASPLEVYAAGEEPAHAPKSVDYSKIPAPPQAKAVIETLQNKNWPKSVIVADVTGSMAPYNAQVMLFIKGKLEGGEKSVLRVVLFNDGDNKRDERKKAGNTGGIYSFVPKSVGELSTQLSLAMNAGSGGDLPENNVEALIQAQKDSPEALHLVLIADNLATPRDLHLAAKVLIPVHVIVCGFSPVLNPAWLDIARMTKGTVEFMGRSYSSLDSVEEGGKLTIGQSTFVLRAGKFDYDY